MRLQTEFGDDELTVRSLAADPDAAVGPDAVPFAALVARPCWSARSGECITYWLLEVA